MYFCSDERQHEEREEREGRGSKRGGRQDVVDLQGNGYFSKLLIISFLCPLNEGYKVNTLYNKAPADASFAHFQRLHCLLGIRKNLDIVWGNLWASSVPLSARPVCISLPALPVNVVSRHRARRRRRSRHSQQQTSRQRAKESLSLLDIYVGKSLRDFRLTAAAVNPLL